MVPNFFTRKGGPEIGITLIPVGKIEEDIMEWLKNALERIFHRNVQIGNEIPKPDFAFNKIRNQYLSTSILNAILEQKEYLPDEKILGIVDHDLYVPQLNFVFGEARGRVAVISLTRLRQTFYHLPEDRYLFYKRTLTEAVHELGHAYGLGHCHHSRCVMFFSNNLRDTDKKGSEFCQRCKKQLPFSH